MGPLTPLVELLGPVGLVLLVVAAVLGAVAVDRALRWPIWVVGGLLAAEFINSLDQTTTVLLRGDDVGAIPILGPLETGLVLLVCLFALVRPHPRPGPPLLWGAACAYLGSGLLLDALFHGFFSFDVLLRLAVVTVIWRAPSLDPERVVRGIQALLAFMLAGSLATWAMGLPGAVEPYGGGSFSVLPFRVSGTLSHANGLGPIAVYWLVIDRFRPLPKPWRVPFNVAAVALLIASQSKTAWAQGLFVIVVLWVASESTRRQLQVIGLAAIVATTGLLLVGFELTDVLGTDSARQLTTLTGRTDVWADGLREWREVSVLTGAGGDVFREYALRTGQAWAGQAHNQVIQTLASYGLLGLAALLGYVAAMVRVAWTTRDVSNNASLALAGALLLRSMTETPLDSLGVDHIVTIMLLFTWQRQAHQMRRPPAGTRSSPGALAPQARASAPSTMRQATR